MDAHGLESTGRKLGLLGVLYLSQGLPFGFFTQALPVLMRKHGYSLEVIGLTTMLAIPWALKFLWAPLVDRTGSVTFGRRRSWIIPIQALTVLTLVLIALMPESVEIQILLIGVFITNVLSATQDIATDGLAVDMLSKSERGFANGIQVAGYRMGMIIGGGVLLIVYDGIGQSGTFLGMAGILLLATIPIFLHKEKTPTFELDKQEQAKPSVMGFLRKPGVGRIVLLIVIYKVGDAFATGMLRPFLADVGFSLTDIGWLLGTVGFVAGLLGALVGGAFVNRLGRKRALLLFAFLQAMTVLGYAVMTIIPHDKLYLSILLGAEHFAGGMATAALFTCMMDWCRPEASATDYTVQASLVVIATGVASALSGFSAGLFGYSVHFMLATLFAFMSIMAVSRLYPESHSSLKADTLCQEGHEVELCA